MKCLYCHMDISHERPKQAVVSSKILDPFPLKLGTSFRISALITVNSVLFYKS